MTVKLRVKVVPRAACSELAGWHGDRLRIRIAAVPEGGRANAELVSFLAARLGVPKRSVVVSSGQTSTLKTVEIDGIDPQEIEMRLR